MDDDWSAGHPPDADVVVVHTPTFQVNENTSVTRHRKWRWWTSKLTVRTDQNPVSSNMVYRLFLIDRADERVDSFQKRPTKTPVHFCLISFGLLSSRQTTQPCVRRFVVSLFRLPSAGSNKTRASRTSPASGIACSIDSGITLTRNAAHQHQLYTRDATR